MKGKAKGLLNIGLNFSQGVIAISSCPEEEGEKFIHHVKAVPEEIGHKEGYGEEGMP